MKSPILFLLLVPVLGACHINPAPLPAYPTISPAVISSPEPPTSAPLLSTVTLTGPTPTPASPFCKAVPGEIQQACTSPATGLRYWLYLPQEAHPAGTKPPLVVYLHGFSHSGLDLSYVLNGGFTLEIVRGRRLSMAVVSPQCPYGENWQDSEMIERLSRLVNEVTAEFGTDPKRTYLTGFSMGGDGVWALGITHPEQFAALAPVGSWYVAPKNMCVLREVPVWDFQGEADMIVSPTFAKDIVEALKYCGGNVRLTLFPEEGHEQSSFHAYGMDELYQWFLVQTK